MSFEIIPFRNSEDVLSCIPEIYKTNLQWFTITPKFTTVRVNTLKYNAENVAESIRRTLYKESSILGCKLQPEVFVHHTIRDCVVIGSWDSFYVPNLNKCGEVIIDVPCGNAVLRGANIFAPGVLSLSPKTREGEIVEIYVDLRGKCRRGYIKNFCGDKIYIGSGIAKMNRNMLFANNAKLNGVAVEVIYRISNVPSINIQYDCGLLQNLPSIICSYTLELSSDSEVLDMCASPGNKTTHIAILMENMGRIVALDKNLQKVAKIMSLSSSFGLTNIFAYIWDSTKAVTDDSSQTNEGPPFKTSTFNRILLDAPCSALGHRPNLYNKITLRQLKSYVSLQRKLFHNAVELLKPGGILVYSTCTITVEENEGMVKWALNKYSDLKLSKSEPLFGLPGLEERKKEVWFSALD
ncbi:tRNA (cytosine(72)-C(5))-methyltransferase NSUN6 isoform X2 [Rhodnius prolixus]|uniref:tRNA (cytosine(72)-C(5))-methyltransferase NSUN6 isoform X2 n=1 Tax=Rhodnius prolixus TaxID=13249 RepID=UPI003D18AB75